MGDQASIDEKVDLESLNHEGEYRLKLLERCPECMSNNFYIWGTKINGSFNIEIRCIKCGMIIQ